MRRLYLILLACLLLRLGSFFLNSPSYPVGSQVRLEEAISAEPTISFGKQWFRIGQLEISAPISPDFHYGDVVAVEGVVGEGNRLDKPTVVLVEDYNPNFWERAALEIRTNFIETYQSVLSRDEANLLSGVVLGSVGLDRQFRSKLAGVGLTHVVAASGMNVTLFSGFIVWLLSVVRLGKMLKALLSMGFIVFYSTITGFEPSIVRASLMAGMMILATIVGRQGSSFWGLITAAYLMLWASPNLVTSASFLLSFSAMTSQVCLGAFASSLPRGGDYITAVFEGVKDIFWQSFLAIIFTLPIVLWFFAKFSLVSLLSNTLTLWTVEPLMILGGLMGVLGIFSQDLARMVALPAGPLLAFFLGVVDALSGKEYFIVNWKISGWMFPVGYYLALGGFVWWWHTSGTTTGAQDQERI